jgi:hypothetical protein
LPNRSLATFYVERFYSKAKSAQVSRANVFLYIYIYIYIFKENILRIMKYSALAQDKEMYALTFPRFEAYCMSFQGRQAI